MSAPAVLDDTPGYLAVSSALAFELAAGLSRPTDIFERHGIDEAGALALLADSTFQKLLKEAHQEWTADHNAEERIRMKARLALEELLAPTLAMARDPRIPAPSRTDATKLFERLSGVGKSESDSGGGGPKFILNLHLGNSEAPRQIEGEVIDAPV